MTKIIDSHLHLFDLQAGKYHWLSPDNPPFWPDKSHIAHSVAERDLVLPPAYELAGFVHIEAGFDNEQPWREVDHLLKHCRLPFAAVAGFDLLAHNHTEILAQFDKRPCITGVRHILDDQAAAILNHQHARVSFARLDNAGLSFDAQLSLYDDQGVNALARVADAFPELMIVLNHGGFPLSHADASRWKDNINVLSDKKNIAMKFSGWEMDRRQWQPADIEPFIDFVLRRFGADRIMLASNFPLCTWRYNYADYWSVMMQCVPVSLHEQLAHNNAVRWYRLPSVQPSSL